MLNIGIAGIGFMGMVHYLTYEKMRNARVTAICTRNRKRLAGDWRGIQGNFGPAGKKMSLAGVTPYDSIDDMLADPSIDLVDITLPPNLHMSVAKRAMHAGKHVFCEKPLAMNLREARQMIAVSEETGMQLMVGHVLPFFPEYAWALKIVRSGKYGKLLSGSFKRVVANPAWLKNYWSASEVGGPMLDLHVHDAHFIRLLFGMPSTVRTQGRMHQDLPQLWNTQFGFENSSQFVQATSGAIEQQGRSFSHGFEIELEKATLSYDFAVIGGKPRLLCPATLFNSGGKVIEPKLTGDPMDAFMAELKAAVAGVGKGSPSDILSAEIACDAIRLCEKQTESLRRGRVVRCC